RKQRMEAAKRAVRGVVARTGVEAQAQPRPGGEVEGIAEVGRKPPGADFARAQAAALQHALGIPLPARALACHPRSEAVAPLGPDWQLAPEPQPVAAERNRGLAADPPREIDPAEALPIIAAVVEQAA